MTNFGPTRLGICACTAAFALSFTGCGGDDGGSAASPATVTVATTVTEASSSPTAADTTSASIPEPEQQDFKAVAIDTIRKGTSGFRGWDDEGIATVLQGVCDSLYVTDGRNIDKFGFETAELVVESSGGTKADVPIVMRGAVAFCPQAFDAIVERYGA